MKLKQIVLLGLVLIIAVVVFRIESTKLTTTNIDTNIGSLAPDFELLDIEGKSVKLSDFRGKDVVLNFWASWCPPCRTEMPEFQKIYSEELVVIGVNLQESEEDVLEFVSSFGLTFPILFDPDAQVKSMYNVFTQPVTYFIDSNGRIVDKKLGPLTVEEIEEKVGKMSSVELEAEDAVPIIDPSKFLSGGPPKDGIPSIDDPKFETNVDWLTDSELGLGILYKGEARFYPFRILVNHEIVNDFIQGDPILVTYCPLCFTGIGFVREIDGEAVEFGVSGKLYNSELVMYDRKSDSYWPQSLGLAVAGPLTGTKIKKIVTDTVMWRDWKKVHPETKVLSRDTGFFNSYSGRNPYGADLDFTDINLQFPLENEDLRLPEYEIVYGVEVDGNFKAYKKSDLESLVKIEDSIGGVSVIIEFDKDLKSAHASKESGEEIIVETLFWFAWAAFHPDTELYLE